MYVERDDASLFVDGLLNAATVQTITPAGNTSPLYIGQFGGNSDRLSGTIDEVRIYNRALSQAEIQTDMNPRSDELDCSLLPK